MAGGDDERICILHFFLNTFEHIEPTSSQESAVRGVISCDFFNLSFHRFFVLFSMVFRGFSGGFPFLVAAMAAISCQGFRLLGLDGSEKAV